MGSQHADAPVLPGTRRARREAEARSRRSGRPNRAPGRRVVRSGLLTGLAALTIVLPLTGSAVPGTGATVAGAAPAAAATTLPSTVEALTGTSVDLTPPATIAAGTVAVDRSGVAAASRSQERAPLPGCVGTTRAAGANGELDPADLCTLWDGAEQLRADAATALAEMDLAFRARFGRDLCLVDGYRTLTEQRIVKAQKGGLAATPGKSNHGWGLAVDLCSTDTSGETWDWLLENGVVYGWENPAWAKSGGSGPFEPWHWEYSRGVLADGEHYES